MFTLSIKDATGPRTLCPNKFVRAKPGTGLSPLTNHQQQPGEAVFWYLIAHNRLSALTCTFDENVPRHLDSGGVKLRTYAGSLTSAIFVRMFWM